jgi:ADP-ribosylglycohydrolase
MLGAIAGDIIGSVYEARRSWQDEKNPHFDPLFATKARFTDDTVLTIAVADQILHGGDLVDLLKDYARSYPDAGYGGTFLRWSISEDSQPYGSWGNGSAMRVSPVGFAFDDLDEVLIRARWTAEVTHNHPEGIKGAQATAAAVHLARTGSSKDEIREYVERKFGYDLSPTIDQIRPVYTFDVSCQGSVPQAILAFLESDDYEHAVRLAISLGGDADTLACIAGGIAHAYYREVPGPIREQAISRLDDRLRGVVEEFEARYRLPTRSGQ